MVTSLPGTRGKWAQKVLHACGEGNDGAPYAGLIFDAAGNLYGTTLKGGIYAKGTVFEIRP